MSDTRLYYEAHITVQAGDDFEKFAGRMRAIQWRASRFEEDEVDDMSGMWFASTRARSRPTIFNMMLIALGQMAIEGYLVLRWKIEDTVLDSNHGDRIEQLHALR